MKTIALIFTLVALWQNPERNQENRLTMHASFETDRPSMVLDGVWKFRGWEAPSGRDTLFYLASVDDSHWRTMPVPGMWELNGFGDPVYVTSKYPWKWHYENNPPFVPEKNNHVGQYRHTFYWNGTDVDESVTLRIGAVTSNVRVWLNGCYVGYSEDSRLAADFDVTALLRQGENLLALEVFRWCDGTYLEDQDCWRLSGISRSVELLRRPAKRLEDLRVEANSSGRLRLEMQVTPGVKALRFRLKSPSGRVRRWKISASGDTLSLERQLRHPKLWSAETPHLYALEIDVLGARGRRCETVRTEVGFRDVEVKGKQLLVNGKPVLLKGVNRHEMSPDGGYCMTREQMEADVRLLKQLNINAVRTSHYPDDPYWYMLCDRYGIYVMDEADIESHGIGYDPEKTLADKPEWKQAHRERFERMVRRDRNHPCIILWSLGNEAGNGANHAANYRWGKREDPTRPVIYQKLQARRDELDWTDIEFYHYRSPEFCEQYLTDGRQIKPFLLQEYAHAMGNSLGNFREYWDLVRKYDGFQGGFIWDFADQALRHGDGWAIGGDYNDYDAWSGSMHCNGLLTSDRQWHPHAWEAAFVHRDILVEATPQEAGQGIIRLHNEYFFKGLENFRMNWEILCNGVPTSLRGHVNRLRVGPGETKSIRLRGFHPADWEKMKGEICLNLSFVLKRSEGLLDKGTELSWGQVLLREARPGQDELPSEAKGPWEMRFRKVDGFLGFWSVAGKELLSAPLMPCFGRAVTENDFGAQFERTMSAWLYPQFKLVALDYDGNLRECGEELVCSGGAAQLEAQYDLGGDVRVRMEYRISEAGALDVDTRLEAPETAPDLFRLGLSFAMNGSFDNLAYYGLGPFENYADRKAAARLGYYAQRVADQYHWGYVRPQESGNHEELRWMRLTDAQGYGLFACSDSLFSGSALPLSREMLDLSVHEPGNIHYPVPLTWQKHYHSYDLVPLASLEDRSKGNSWIHLDARQMGVGGINTWGEKPLEEYRIHSGSHSFHFKLVPINI